MQQDGAAAYGAVFHVVFVMAADMDLDVDVLSAVRTANLRLIKVSHVNSG
jgi:hypothetical protein